MMHKCSRYFFLVQTSLFIGFCVSIAFSEGAFGQSTRRPTGDPYFSPLTPQTGSTQSTTLRPVSQASHQSRLTPQVDSAQRHDSSNPVGPDSFQPQINPKKPAELFEPGKVVAMVAGEPIFMGDMAFEINELLNKFMPGAPQWAKDQNRGELAKRLVKKYVDARLLYVDVKKRLPEQVNVSDIRDSLVEQFDNSVAPEMSKKVGVPGSIALDGYLRSKGTSLRQVREAWITDAIVKYFLPKQHQFEKEITHSELLDYYRANQSEFEIKPKARWEQLMARFDKFNSRQEAERAIREMGDEVYYGAPLDAVAKRKSQGFRASQGGQHDWTFQGSLSMKKIDEAIFSIPLNRLSSVIETKHGYHIVRVIERVDRGTIPFREAQVEIKKKLQSQKRETALQKHLAKIRQQIPHEILVDTSAPTGK